MQVSNLCAQFGDLFIKQRNLPLAFSRDRFLCGKFLIGEGQKGRLPFGFGFFFAKIALELLKLADERVVLGVKFGLSRAGRGQ